MKIGKGLKIAYGVLGVYVLVLFACLAFAGDLSIAFLAAGSSFVMFGLLIWVVAKGVDGFRRGYRGEYAEVTPGVKDTRTLCTHCGTIAEQVWITNFSWIIAFLLLMFFLIPGIFYMAYCHANAHWGCPRCRSREIIPLDAPAAAKVRATFAVISQV